MLRDVWPAHRKPDFGMDYALPLKWQQGLGAVGLWPRCSFGMAQPMGRRGLPSSAIFWGFLPCQCPRHSEMERRLDGPPQQQPATVQSRCRPLLPSTARAES